MLTIGVLVSGGGTNLQAIIEAVEQGYIPNAKIGTVVSSNPNAFGLVRAQTHNIPAICMRKKDFSSQEFYEMALVSHLKEQKVDLIALAGFMVILSETFVKAFPGRIMNIHPSLIPSFCGAGCYGLKVHEAVLKRGVKVTGATVHFVTEETDGGPIILQKAVDIAEEDTPESLQQRVMREAEWIIYPEAIRLFAENQLRIINSVVKRRTL